MRSRDDEPEELATTTEALADEDEPKVLTTIMEASAEEAEDKTRPSEHLRWRRRWCVYGLRVLTTTTEASAEYDRPAESATTTEASAEDEEYTTHPRDWRQWRRRRG